MPWSSETVELRADDDRLVAIVTAHGRTLEVELDDEQQAHVHGRIQDCVGGVVVRSMRGGLALQFWYGEEGSTRTVDSVRLTQLQAVQVNQLRRRPPH